MKENKSPLFLDVNKPSEDIELGIQRIYLDINRLYSNLNKSTLFEQRLKEFLNISSISKVVEYSERKLCYLTESVIPNQKDSRPPLLLIFGNPTPDSILDGCFFSSEKRRYEHRFWSTLEKAKIISFINSYNNTIITRSLFELDYESPFRIGLAVFYSIPSPASDPKWSGVAGIKKLFRAEAFRIITSCEKIRVEQIIRDFIGNDSRGAVIVFQKDAYIGIRDDDIYENIVAKYDKWFAVETKCSILKVRLFKMPPTRYMNALWYIKFLQKIARLLFKE